MFRKNKETPAEQAQYIRPRVDIYENENGIFITADLPGVDPKDLDLSLDQGILTLKAPAKATKGDKPQYREFVIAGFYRQFQLPREADLEGISANLKDGVLSLVIPPVAAAKPHMIPVKSA